MGWWHSPICGLDLEGDDTLSAFSAVYQAHICGWITGLASFLSFLSFHHYCVPQMKTNFIREQVKHKWKYKSVVFLKKNKTKIKCEVLRRAEGTVTFSFNNFWPLSPLWRGFSHTFGSSLSLVGAGEAHKWPAMHLTRYGWCPQHRTKTQLEQVVTVLSATKVNPANQTNKNACEVQAVAFVEMSVTWSLFLGIKCKLLMTEMLCLSV